jgi:peroxiredoxin (alkyl hydroperoxide reductase subunit C)
MRRALYLLPVITLLFALSGFAQLNAQTGPDNAPKVGDMAPDFQVSAGGRGAQPMALKDFAGKKRVLLMFFPAAFSPGCTTEFTEAGQFYDKINALNIQMLGISADLSFAQTAFKNSVAPKGPDGKPLPLEALSFVSDRTLSIAQKYDAANPNNAKRYYFLIDDKGKILWRSVNNSLIPTDKLITDLGAILKGSSN